MYWVKLHLKICSDPRQKFYDIITGKLHLKCIPIPIIYIMDNISLTGIVYDMARPDGLIV